MLNALYGTKIKVVEGYGGSQESLLAVERNEVDGHVSGGSSAAFRARIAPLAQEGYAKVILQMGMTRDAAYPDIPTAIEIMPTAEGKQLFEIAFAEQVMGRPFVLPPGVPADRVKVLARRLRCRGEGPGAAGGRQGAEHGNRPGHRRGHQRAARPRLCGAAGTRRAAARNGEITKERLP